MSKKTCHEKEIKLDYEKAFAPAAYKGLYGFHKYWGKKPVECISFIIEAFSNPKDLIVDPFMGFGTVAREAVIRDRRFIGTDLNPVAKELSSLLVNLPDCEKLQLLLENMEHNVIPKIDDTYIMENGNIATHYLWNNEELLSIWEARRGRNGRKTYEPSDWDSQKINEYEDYLPKYVREPQFFRNSRINAHPSLKLRDFFTGRALHNIELILDFIYSQPEDLQQALLLILTASVGQMSKMVFAINNRGKSSNAKRNVNGEERIEVGSWVIGFWRPELHFELNAWNCYKNKADKLLKAVREEEKNGYSFKSSNSIHDVISSKANVSILNSCAFELVKKMSDNSINLLVTDPPHTDRTPYLELSELWNAVLGKTANFSKEIVLSNAKERDKDKLEYETKMAELFENIEYKMAEDGYVVVLFNAKNDSSWRWLKEVEAKTKQLQYIGCLPMYYSAGSVVQDNRKGSLKNDFILIWQKNKIERVEAQNWFLKRIPGWSEEFPR